MDCIEDSDWLLAAGCAASALRWERIAHTRLIYSSPGRAADAKMSADIEWAHSLAWLAEALFGAEFRARRDGRTVAR